MDAPTPPELSRAPLSQADVRAIFYGLMLAMFLSALDGTIVATAMPTIGRELGDVAHLPWIVTAYLLASTAATPLYGKFADMHGRRVTLLTAIAIFVGGSIACALSPNLPALALSRALQGLGGGGLLALSQIIIGDLVAPRERGRYQVYFGIVFASASVLGPALGGVFAELLHWSWIFWINAPLGLVTLALVNARLKRLPRFERRHRLDILGALLMTAATCSLMLAINWGGVSYPWSSMPVVGLFVASLVLWVAFGVRLATAIEPLIPPQVLKDAVVATGTVAGSLVMGTYVGLTVTVPIFFETGLGLSARESGLALVPFMVGVPIGATLSGRAMAALDHYKRVPLAGLALATLSQAAIALFATRGPFWLTEGLFLLVAIGLGTAFPVTTVAIQNAVRPHHLGTATANMNFARQLTAAIVVAIFGAIALGGAGGIEGATARLPIELSAFTRVFWAGTIGFALALAALIAMEERPLLSRPALDTAPID